jgi:hypothetical protein
VARDSSLNTTCKTGSNVRYAVKNVVIHSLLVTKELTFKEEVAGLL